MRRVLRFALAAAVLVGVAWWVHGLPGTFSARIGDTVLQTTTPVALLLGAVLFALLYLFVRGLGVLVRLPRYRQRKVDRKRRARGDAAVTRTLVALAAGDGAGARRDAQRGRGLLGDTPMTLLLAAQAARLAGAEDEAGRLYGRIALPAPKDRAAAAFLGHRGLFRQAMDRGDWDAAARHAADAERAQPGAAWLRDERARLALRTGQWRDALRLGADSAAVKTAAAEAEENAGAALKLARTAWEADPALAPAALAYARRLRNTGKERVVGEVLRRTWALSPHPDVATFALAPLTDPLLRIRAATDLVRIVAESPESHLLLGRVSLEAGLPGEALRHAQAARAGGMAERRLYLLFADIAEAEGDAAGARAALRNEAAADADPAWRCEACGSSPGAWNAACPQCGTGGSLRWTKAGAGAGAGRVGDEKPRALSAGRGTEVVLP